MNASHLCRRAVGSLRNNPVTVGDMQTAEASLLPGEFALWCRMQNRDQRHSLQVLGRFLQIRPQASRDERAAALLHDVGKAFSTLGWWGRIVATLVGPRTAAFGVYLDHERLGIEALEGVSSERTLQVLSGTDDDPCTVALRAADDV